MYLPQDWVEVVRDSNVTKPFETTTMQQEDFLDWKGFVNKGYKMAIKDQEGKWVLLRDIHWLNFRWREEKEVGKVSMTHHPDEVWVRFSFSKDEPWKKLKIVWPKQTTIGQSIPWELYQGQVLLTERNNGITEKHTKTVQSKATPMDMQGQHHNHPHKITEDLKNQGTVHYMSDLHFPPQPHGQLDAIKELNKHKEKICTLWTIDETINIRLKSNREEIISIRILNNLTKVINKLVSG